MQQRNTSSSASRGSPCPQFGICKAMQDQRARGFTLMEVVVVVAILALLAGVVVPVFRSAQQDGQASKILAVADTLKKATEKHFADTGRLATEYSPTTAGAYTGVAQHHLSMTQTYANWRGPYLDHPLTRADNPFQDAVYVYPALNIGQTSGGFNLTGGGANTHTSAGQTAVFYGVPQVVAERVDAALDKNIPGSWQTTGRVEYSNNILAIFLMAQ
jgi:prepilin-type N-terminal cleavage/methylation domain-containing protein